MNFCGVSAKTHVPIFIRYEIYLMFSIHFIKKTIIYLAMYDITRLIKRGKLKFDLMPSLLNVLQYVYLCNIAKLHLIVLNFRC